MCSSDLGDGGIEVGPFGVQVLEHGLTGVEAHDGQPAGGDGEQQPARAAGQFEHRPTLGEPFDRPLPQGLRTLYPLTAQTLGADVLRKGVSYELPPLSPAPTRPRRDTTRPGGAS